jgi:hypothetical protein
MSGGYVEKRLKKTNRRLITIGVIVLIITLVVCLSSLSYYISFFSGPTHLTGQVLKDDLADGYLDNNYVEVTFDDIYDSGMYSTTTDDNGNEIIASRYYVVTLGDYEIILETDSAAAGETITGELYSVREWAVQQFVDKIAEVEPGTRKIFFPAVMAEEDFMQRGYYGLALAALFLFLSLSFIITGARHKHKPELHPSMKDLARMGPTEFVISRLNIEMEAPHEKIGKNHFLASHLLIETRSGFSAVSYNDIVWVYKQSAESKNFGIHFGIITALMICDRAGRALFAPCKEGELERMVALLQPRIPYAYKGYTTELASMWREDPKMLNRGVDERKVSVASIEGMPPLPVEGEADDSKPDGTDQV